MAFDQSYSVHDFKSVGTRPVRPDGVDKVTGRARYGADYNMPGQLVGRILRSPHAHAKIRRIDTSKAEKLKGVKAVITAADLPDFTDGDADLYNILDNCMARGKALYDGHAVAAVAAIDAHTARAALELIDVDYEVLPHVIDVDEAMTSSAHVVTERVSTGNVDPELNLPANVSKRTEYGHGDVEAGFKKASVVIERSFKTEQTHQGYIEPHACVASVNSDGTGNYGYAPRAILPIAIFVRGCSAWKSPSCVSPPRRLAAALAERPTYGWNRLRWRCHARRVGRSSL